MTGVEVWSGQDSEFEGAEVGEQSDEQVEKSYRALRFEYRKLVRRSNAISRGTGGISSTGNQMFWSSVLFTRLTVLAESVQNLCPDAASHYHWDCSSVQSLVRNLAECYFVAHFLCFDKVDEDERQARFLMMHLHDNFSRTRMLNELGIGKGEDGYYAENFADLEGRIRQTRHFTSLPEKRQRAILKGDRTPFVQDEVLEKIGFDRETFRGLYRMMSSHTHTGPISFYRMGEIGRGTGVKTRAEMVYTSMAIGLALQLLTRACDDVLEVFPNAESRGSKVSPRDVGKHLHKLKQAQLNGEVIEP